MGRALAEIAGRASRHVLALRHALYFSDEEMDGFFRGTDLLVIPYGREHRLVSGLVYLAASRACPVISSTHSESGELPREHGFGYSFAPGDAEGLREGLRRCASLGDAERIQLRRGAEVFAREHSWTHALGNIWHVIQAGTVL